MEHQPNKNPKPQATPGETFSDALASLHFS